MDDNRFAPQDGGEDGTEILDQGILEDELAEQQLEAVEGFVSGATAEMPQMTEDQPQVALAPFQGAAEGAGVGALASPGFFAKKLALPVWALLTGVLGILVLAGVGGGFAGAAITDRSEEIEMLTTQRAGLSESVTELEEELRAVKKENWDLENEVADIERREKDLEQASQELAGKEEELAELEAEVANREAAVTKAEDAAAKNEFGNGVHLVGVDIEPGTYRNDGGDLCYWARLRGTSGGFNDIIANGIPDGPTVVTIASSDVAFESSGCGTWKRTQ